MAVISVCVHATERILAEQSELKGTRKTPEQVKQPEQDDVLKDAKKSAIAEKKAKGQ